MEASRKQRRDEHRQIRDNAPVDLRGVPLHIAKKAAKVIDAIASGQNLLALGLQKMHDDPDLVSFPVSREYRLVCRQQEGLVPLQVLSHEDYNCPVKRAQRRQNKQGRGG